MQATTIPGRGVDDTLDVVSALHAARTDADAGLFEAATHFADLHLGARRYVADALDVRHRLPLIWARVQARRARIGNGRLVAARTRHLSVEAAPGSMSRWWTSRTGRCPEAGS